MGKNVHLLMHNNTNVPILDEVKLIIVLVYCSRYFHFDKKQVGTGNRLLAHSRNKESHASSIKKVNDNWPTKISKKLLSLLNVYNIKQKSTKAGFEYTQIIKHQNTM